MPEQLGIHITPEMLRGDFMPLLQADEERTFAQLASGLGSKDLSKPRRVVGRYAETAQILGLAESTSSGVRLTVRGLQFRGDPTASKASVRAAFCDGHAYQVFKALSTSFVLTRDEAHRRMSAIGRNHELAYWLDWLRYADLISVYEESISFSTVATRPLALYSTVEMRIIEEERYRALAAFGYHSHSTEAVIPYKTIVESLRNFRAAPPEKSEKELKRFVALAFSLLGIVTQIDDGPREKANRAVNFGIEGEDAVGFFLRPPLVWAESLRGLVIPMELKRAASDKKAVGQAVTAAGRWRSYFGGKARVLPVTISDSATYAEKSARDYALANGVVHFSVDTLAEVIAFQKELFESGKRLLTAVHLC